MLVPHTQHIYILNQHHTFCVGVCYWLTKKYVWRFLLAKMSECSIGLMLVHITEGKLNLFPSLPSYTHTCCFRYRNKINQSKGMICIYIYNNLIWLVLPINTLYRLQSLDSLEVLSITLGLPDWLLSWICQQQSLRKLAMRSSNFTELPDKYVHSFDSWQTCIVMRAFGLSHQVFPHVSYLWSSLKNQFSKECLVIIMHNHKVTITIINNGLLINLAGLVLYISWESWNMDTYLV